MPVPLPGRFGRQIAEMLQGYAYLAGMARAQGMSPPLLFGGVAVYLAAAGRDFRPSARRLRHELDLVILPGERDRWAHALRLAFRRHEGHEFTGWSAETEHAGTQLDVLVSPAFGYRFPGGSYRLQIDSGSARLLAVPGEPFPLRLVSPEQLLAFKLLRGREPDSGKFDFEDAAALILHGGVTPGAFMARLAKQGPLPPALRDHLLDRLRRCAASGASPAVMAFARSFSRLARA